MVLKLWLVGIGLVVDYQGVVDYVVQVLFVFGEGGYQEVDVQGEVVQQYGLVVIEGVVMGQVVIVVVYDFDVDCYFVQCGVVL